MLNKLHFRTRWLKESIGTLILLFTLSIGSASAQVSLPFEWTVATNNTDAISYPSGVTQNSIGTYSSNYPYRLQYNAAGDYIQIYTNKAAEDISFSVKKIGGAGNSTFVVEGCATASGTYSTINSFTIEGAQNAIVSCTTTASISSTYRYFRIRMSVKGANVGLGYVNITTPCTNVDVTGGSAVILPKGTTTYTTSDWGNNGAPTGAYPTSATVKNINGYCVTFTNAYENNNANGLQVKASGGVISMNIVSNSGVDVEVVCSGTNGFSIALTGATTKTGQTGTATISTTTANSTLTITKNTSSVGYIKTVKITPKVATCSDPTGLNKSSLSATGVTLSVTSASANYDLYYNTSSTAPTSSSTATATISSGTSKAITGLTYGTKYYYWARHDCGSGSKSDWVAGSGSYFTTSAPAPSKVVAGSITMEGATLTITDSNSPASYDIYYSTSSTAPTASTTPSTTSTIKTKELTGLTSGQTYYYWVRGHGPNAQSSWVAGTPTTFTTVSLSSISIQTPPTKTVYLAGELFDPTGLVITRNYSNSTSDTYAYAGHTSDFTFSPTTSTALTKSHTSVTITYSGKTASQAITVYGLTLQALDENGDAIASGGPGVPTFTAGTRAISPATDAANYKFWKWEISGATLGSSATTKNNSITSPTGDVTVTAKYYLPRTVTWMVNKEPWTPESGGGSGTNGTAEVARGTKWNALTLPTDPTTSDGCGEKFIGWTSSEISGKLVKGDDDAAITTLYTNLLTSDNKSTKTTAINNNIVFHAVFVDYVTE